MLITRLLLILEVYSTKPTHTKSWARNFLMLDLTLGPSFKVKQWFTGFGELSFRWIQLCIGLRCVGLVYLGVYVAFNTVQVISRWVVGRAEETSTYSWSRFCTVNCRPTARNYQLSHLRSGWEPNSNGKGGRLERTLYKKLRRCFLKNWR